MKIKTPLSVLLVCLTAIPGWAETLPAFISGQVPDLVETYKGIHAHPELSHHEEHTSAPLAGELRKAGYSVTERVGRYPDGNQAYGVVAILQNGPGKRLLSHRHDVGCNGSAAQVSAQFKWISFSSQRAACAGDTRSDSRSTI